MQTQGLSKIPVEFGRLVMDIRGVSGNQTITKEVAEALLKHDIEYAVGVVNNTPSPALKDSSMPWSILCLTSDQVSFFPLISTPIINLVNTKKPLPSFLSGNTTTAG
jgi:hypothetical protein